MARNKGPVAAAVLVFLALAGGIAGTTAGLVCARAEEQRARDAEADARRESERAQGAERGAVASAAEARAALAFLRDRILRAGENADAFGGASRRHLSLFEALTAAEPHVGPAFVGQPRLEAAVRTTLGGALAYLGEGARGVGHLERAVALSRGALGPGHPDTLSAVEKLVMLEIALHRFPEGSPGRSRPKPRRCGRWARGTPLRSGSGGRSSTRTRNSAATGTRSAWASRTWSRPARRWERASTRPARSPRCWRPSTGAGPTASGPWFCSAN